MKKAESKSLMMLRHLKKDNLTNVIAYLLFFIFAYAAVTKLMDQKTFLFELNLTPAFKKWDATLYWTVPIMEALIAITLLIRQTMGIGFIAALILLIIYLILQFNLKMYVPHIRGGILNNLSYNNYLMLNTALLMLALTGLTAWLLKPRKKKMEHQTPEIIFT